MRSTMTRLVTGTILALTLVACLASPASTVLGVTIDGGDRSIAVGSTLALTATVEAAGVASDAVTWTSSDETVATVDTDGHVTSVAAGSTDIVATSVVDPTLRDARIVTVEAIPNQAGDAATPLPVLIASTDASTQAPAIVAWAETHDFAFENPAWTGNAYDVVATATFTHATAPSVTTELFYDGGNAWVARFRGSELGVWTFTTSSAEPALDGRTGSVEVVAAPATKLGPVEIDGELLVRQRDNGADSIVLQPYAFDEDTLFDHIGLLSTDPTTRAGEIQSIFDNVQAAGMDGLMVYTYNNVFSFGHPTYASHASTDPDPFTFQVMEELLDEASVRGMYLHVWFWGDEQDTETPIGVGGINGIADQRMQRYVAARLGPKVGWIGSYGYDLVEWVTPAQMRDWEAYIDAHAGWDHLLMAREQLDATLSEHTFILGADKLDIYANDDRPLITGQSFYDQAVHRLTEFGGFPVMFERRFQSMRDGLWNGTETRRSMWQFSIAGVGAIYGERRVDGSYPAADKARFRVHQQFWSTRHVNPRVQVTGISGEYAMRSSDANRYVVVQEDTATVSLPLADLASAKAAVAVDAASETYAEVSLGSLTPGNQTWAAPYESDWVVAVGFDEPAYVDHVGRFVQAIRGDGTRLGDYQMW